MESQTATKPDAQKDVHSLINERIIEQLSKGTVPWRATWMEAGIPTSLISKRPFRGINVMLLATLGYDRNLFLTHKQLETIGGSVKNDEKPHTVVFWASQQDKKPQLKYYGVYNIAQCDGILEVSVPPLVLEANPIKVCENIVACMQQAPIIRHKEPVALYDPLEDYINMPKLKSFEHPASYYSALFHQLAHSTGHHTRLDRMGLVQMSEYGCDEHTQEELVVEIVTNYLENLAGIPYPFFPTDEYVDGWIQKFRSDRYFIFTACTLAQKVIDFILNVQQAEDKEHNEE